MNSCLIVVLLSAVLSALLFRGVFLLLKLNKQEAEAIQNLGRMGTPPDSFTIKGNPLLFVFATSVLCMYLVFFALCVYLYLHGASINYSLGFVLAVLGIGTLALIELRRTIINFCIFFKCQIRVEELQFFYTDWLGRIHTFDIYQIVGWKLDAGDSRAAIGGITVGDFSDLRYKDSSGKTHRIRIGLSAYSKMLLSKYLHHYLLDENAADRK